MNSSQRGSGLGGDRPGPGILGEMKKALAIPAVFVIAVLVYMIRNHADYGEALPPGFPSDIPVVAGEIISGRRTLFEDGRGYVVDVRTDLPYREEIHTAVCITVPTVSERIGK